MLALGARSRRFDPCSPDFRLSEKPSDIVGNDRAVVVPRIPEGKLRFLR